MMNSWLARLDEVRLYHRALTTDEVATLHALTVEGSAVTPARSFPDPVAPDRLRVEAVPEPSTSSPAEPAETRRPHAPAVGHFRSLPHFHRGVAKVLSPSRTTTT